MKKFPSTAIYLLLVCCFLAACSKDSFITSPQASLRTSADTLKFDTVFTTVGSVTQGFKIFNDNDQKLLLTHVRVAGGANSFFKLNADGISGQEITNIEILPNDSIYVFVQVKVNPSSADLPFVIRDSVSISFNGNVRYLQLEAFGQNARFFRSLTLRGSSTWAAGLPIVILGGLLVDTTATLTILKGTKIFLHANAPIIVNGTLRVMGTTEAKVEFAGDRTDPDYRDLPAGWPGIYFSPLSKNNVLDHAIIKNAYQGIISEEGAANVNAKITLSHCIFDNIYDAGIFGIHTSITASNCLVSNCGRNVLLVYGGRYDFTHCTVATYSNFYIDHNFPVLYAANFIEQNNQFFTNDLSASFTNCIFWGEGGSIDNELVLGNKPGANFDVSLNTIVFKNKDAMLADAVFTGNNFENATPMFDSINVSKNFYDFHITKVASSPAIDTGVPTAITDDLDGKPRTPMPDIGCYEK